MFKDTHQTNEFTKDAWNANAQYWDDRMAEDGNDFVNKLIWPPTKKLLNIKAGQTILDIGCGNGLYSRRLADLGVLVVAFDFAKEMIARAEERTIQHKKNIRYLVLDATDKSQLMELGQNQFDSAMCNMVLFDMAEIETLIETLSSLLRPGGVFVFSIIHPCFNSPHATPVAELQDRDGDFVTIYSMKVDGYMTPTVEKSAAIPGQPKPQLIFHRPLHQLLGAFFKVGFVLDALEERAFPTDHPSGKNPLSWGGNFSEIPAVLVARMRLLS